MAEDFAGGCVDDADVEVVDEQHDWGAAVWSSDADVVESAVVTKCDFAGLVNAVVANPERRVRVILIGCGFGARDVRGCWGGVVL